MIMEKRFCVVTGDEISQARIEYLLAEGIPEHLWTSLRGAEQIVRKKKGLFINNEATEFIVVNNVEDGGLLKNEESETGDEEL